MSQYSAVYYPHTTLRTPDLLRTALLVWDYVDCIVPWQGFSVTEDLSGSDAEAADIVLRARHPSAKEKAQVHKEVVAAFKAGVPSWVSTPLVDDHHHHSYARHNDHDYLIYPQKFMPETWKELSRATVARWLPHYGDYDVPPALGLTMMASLAGACAGTEQHRVTDRVSAYTALTGMTATSLGGELIRDASNSDVTENIDRLITVSTNILDGKSIPLDRLVKLRQREAKESSQDLRRLRHKYIDAVKQHLSLLAGSKSVGDARELARQFRERMEEDLSDLKKELGMARNDLLLSKEMGVLLLAAAGVVAAPVAASAFAPVVKTVGVGALLATGIKYKRAREKAFREHAMSWLYVADRPWR
jgi:hypothetical protein